MWSSRRAALGAALLALASAAFAAVGEPVVEPLGGFSYRPPRGWETRSFPGLKYRIAVGPVRRGFAVNLNVVDEPHDGDLAAYVDLNLQNMKKVLPDFSPLGRTVFRTAEGLEGVRLCAEDTQSGRRLRQVFYFFSNGRGTMLVATGTAPADAGDAHDAAFDESLRTFRFQP